MLIGLASCMRLDACETADGKRQQPVWDTMRARIPAGRKLDGLLLSGDQVYSGYGVGDALFKPQLKMSAQDFLTLMYGQYRGQFEVPQFQALLATLPVDAGRRRVGMVWDDHDFGYNNSFGTDPRFSVEKRRITRHLFCLFRDALRAFTPGAVFPSEPTLAQATADEGEQGVDEALSWPGVQVFMPDQRMHAQSSKADAPRRMQRPADWARVVEGLRANTGGWSVLVSGRPYSVSQKGRPDFWQMYEEAADLRAVAAQAGNVVIFCGDLHRNVKPIQHPGMLEVITSGAAQDGRNKENFGLLELSGPVASVRLYTRDQAGPEFEAAFTRAGAMIEVAATRAATQATVQAVAQAGSPAPAAPVIVELQDLDPVSLDAAVMAAPFSTRFLLTNRVIEGDHPTDAASPSLRYFSYPGDGLQARARNLKGWREEAGEAPFFGHILRAFQDLDARHGPAQRQLCVFVHGNRKSNEAVIHQYSEIDRLCFNAAGAGSLGVCVAFDWATNESEKIFDLKATYQDNIDRIPQVAPMLADFLAHARAAADLAGACLSVVGHSLGNRLVIAALGALQADPALGHPFVDHYLLNSADVASTLFQTPDGAMLARSCQKMTVLWADSDRTLDLARTSGTVPDLGNRLGRHGPAPGPLPASVQVHHQLATQCHPQEPHSGLFLTPWPNDQHGALVQRFAQAMQGGCG